MVEPTCEIMKQWEQSNKKVKAIRCDNAGENKKPEQRLASADWQMGYIQFEYTARDAPQQNHLAELGFRTIWDRVRAMLHRANMKLEIRYKLYREAATMLDNLTVIEIDGKKASRIEHWSGKLPKFVHHLRTIGEAGIVTYKLKGAAKRIKVN